MNEALRCDRMSMMHAGRVLDSASPAQLIENRQAETLEEAFIGYLIDAGAGTKDQPTDAEANISEVSDNKEIDTTPKKFSLLRLFSFAWRETLELARDPIRATMALMGSLILLLVMGYGITMDVEDLKFAVLDHDQSSLSQNYSMSIAGSRYFIENHRCKVMTISIGECVAVKFP